MTAFYTKMQLQFGLLKLKAIYPVKIYVYLKFILKEKSEERAKAYYVNHRLNQKKRAEEEDSSTNRGKELRAKMGKDEMAKYLSLPTKDCKNEIDEIDRILQKPHYKNIVSEVQQRKINKKGTQWYSLFDGPANLECLSNSVGCSGLYYLYRFLSKFTHSENELNNIDAQGVGQAGLVQIRNPENAQQITKMAMNYALFSFQIVFKTLKPHCLICHSIFYKQNIESLSTELRNTKIINVIR